MVRGGSLTRFCFVEFYCFEVFDELFVLFCFGFCFVLRFFK